MIFYLLLFLLFFVFFRLGKGTPFEINFKNGNIIGIRYFVDIFVFIIPGIFVFFDGLSKAYTTFYVTDETAISSSYYAIYLIAFFLLTFIILFKLFPVRINLTEHRMQESLSKARGLFASLLVMIVLFLVIFYIFGMRNSFINSIVGFNLVESRMHNRYSGVPTVIISWFMISSVAISIVSGYLFKGMSVIRKTSCFILILYIGTYMGNKAFLVNVFLAFYISCVLANSYEHNVGSLLKRVSAVIIAVVLFVFTVFYQFREVDSFELLDYIINRAVLGQIAGFYEQMGLQLRNIDYIWHSVPFANYLTDYPVFNKDLMMSTWGLRLSDSKDTGVMNSLFGGEAFAIGGYTLMLASPFIVAINYFVTHKVLVWLFVKFGRLDLNFSKAFVLIFVASIYSISGDFSGFFLFKHLFIMLGILLPVLFLSRIKLMPRFNVRGL